MQDSSTISALQKTLHKRRTRRRLLKISLIAGNVVILGLVVAFVIVGPHGKDANSQAVGALSVGTADTAVNPVDQMAAINIAQTVSSLAGLPETSLVNGQMVAEKVQLSTGIATDNTDVLAKRQVVKSTFASNKDIKTYIAKAGDSVATIADKFGVSSNSIIWSNNLSGNSVTVGQKLFIPPIDGIVYTVKAGDTPTKLAQTYNAKQELIIAYNDAEINGIKAGEQILIPGGQKASTNNYFGVNYNYGLNNVYGVSGNYNMYAYNNCTWWVALRWAQTGRPTRPLLGNASQWYYSAERLGMDHGRTPRAHAAAVTSTYGWGHVVFVESVNGDGSINISEMNVDGAASSRVWYSTIPASVANSYLYVY